MKNTKKLLFIIAIQFAITQTVFSQCLLADYTFNGNANDASGNGNNGTVLNGASLTTGYDGTANSAYYFDAVNDVIEVNDTLGNFGTSDYTISCWIKTTLQSGSARFISKRVTCITGGSWFNLAFQDSIIVFETAESGDWNIIYGTTPVNDGNWHHVTVVRSGTIYTLYVDCNTDGSFTTSFLHNTSNNVSLLFGDDVCTNNVVNGIKFTGSLDEIKFFNCALDTNDISALCLLSGIQTTINNIEINIYPNPANNRLNITTALQGNDEVKYQIINALGATAIANKATAKDFSIDVSTLPSGIYFIHL